MFVKLASRIVLSEISLLNILAGTFLVSNSVPLFRVVSVYVFFFPCLVLYYMLAGCYICEVGSGFE
jgi:hypothetical protein